MTGRDNGEDVLGTDLVILSKISETLTPRARRTTRIGKSAHRVADHVDCDRQRVSAALQGSVYDAYAVETVHDLEQVTADVAQQLDDPVERQSRRHPGWHLVGKAHPLSASSRLVMQSDSRRAAPQPQSHDARRPTCPEASRCCRRLPNPRPRDQRPDADQQSQDHQ